MRELSPPSSSPPLLSLPNLARAVASSPHPPPPQFSSARHESRQCHTAPSLPSHPPLIPRTHTRQKPNPIATQRAKKDTHRERERTSKCRSRRVSVPRPPRAICARAAEAWTGPAPPARALPAAPPKFPLRALAGTLLSSTPSPPTLPSPPPSTKHTPVLASSAAPAAPVRAVYRQAVVGRKVRSPPISIRRCGSGQKQPARAPARQTAARRALPMRRRRLRRAGGRFGASPPSRLRLMPPPKPSKAHPPPHRISLEKHS